jgi:hypothetical protein
MDVHPGDPPIRRELRNPQPDRASPDEQPSWQRQLGLGAVKIAAPAAATAQRLPLPLTEIRPDAPPSAAADAVLLGIGNIVAGADLRRLTA